LHLIEGLQNKDLIVETRNAGTNKKSLFVKRHDIYWSLHTLVWRHKNSCRRWYQTVN